MALALFTDKASPTRSGDMGSGHYVLATQFAVALKKARELKLIICTVSETATSEYMYPPDEYCDYIFYTNVITSRDQILAEKDPDSWDAFQKRGAKYRVTQLGISFDFR
ncbi:hypothetical protein MTO96_040977 [Rhipicephalus appendiculatus]